jgi:uncharacterized membrane protein
LPAAQSASSAFLVTALRDIFQFMKHINQIFFQGLIVVMPITLTFYLLYWASSGMESIFSPVLQLVLGKELYIPGFGILVTLIFIFLVGVMVNTFIVGRIVKRLTKTLEKVPLIKVIYNPLRDLMALIPGRSSTETKAQRVVLVPLETLGVHALGLVTREDLEELPGLGLISVYVPLSYMLGGITILIEKEKVKKVDMPVDQALKLSVTAWIKARDRE